MTDEPSRNESITILPLVPRPRGLLRLVLLVVVPLIAGLVVVVLYLRGGRYVGTDNAYVEADKAPISSQVAGTIKDVLGLENQGVTAGQVLFRLDPPTFHVAAGKARPGACRGARPGVGNGEQATLARPVSRGGGHGDGPGRERESMGRGQSHREGSDPRSPGGRGHDSRGHVSRRRLEGRGRKHEPGHGLRVLHHPRTECHRQLGEDRTPGRGQDQARTLAQPPSSPLWSQRRR